MKEKHKWHWAFSLCLVLWERVKDREASCASAHGATESWTWPRDWTTRYYLIYFSQNWTKLKHLQSRKLRQRERIGSDIAGRWTQESDFKAQLVSMTFSSPGAAERMRDPGTPERMRDPGTPERLRDLGTPERMRDSGTPERMRDPRTLERMRDQGTSERMRDPGTSESRAS